MLIANFSAAISLPANLALENNRQSLFGMVVAKILAYFAPNGSNQFGHFEDLLNFLRMQPILISNLRIDQSFDKQMP